MVSYQIENFKFTDMKKSGRGNPTRQYIVCDLCIKINNIINNISLGVDGSLHMDDFLIYYRLKYIHTFECKLQQCLEKINKWVTKNDFRFSKVVID